MSCYCFYYSFPSVEVFFFFFFLTIITLFSLHHHLLYTGCVGMHVSSWVTSLQTMREHVLEVIKQTQKFWKLVFNSRPLFLFIPIVEIHYLIPTFDWGVLTPHTLHSHFKGVCYSLLQACSLLHSAGAQFHLPGQIPLMPHLNFFSFPWFNFLHSITLLNYICVYLLLSINNHNDDLHHIHIFNICIQIMMKRRIITNIWFSNTGLSVVCGHNCHLFGLI